MSSTFVRDGSPTLSLLVGFNRKVVIESGSRTSSRPCAVGADNLVLEDLIGAAGDALMVGHADYHCRAVAVVEGEAGQVQPRHLLLRRRQ